MLRHERCGQGKRSHFPWKIIVDCEHSLEEKVAGGRDDRSREVLAAELAAQKRVVR
jgi:hypothetical protein